jgi:hypothetical protein
MKAAVIVLALGFASCMIGCILVVFSPLTGVDFSMKILRMKMKLHGLSGEITPLPQAAIIARLWAILGACGSAFFVALLLNLLPMVE